MHQTEKDTSSGRDIREYQCDVCGYDYWENRGPALWQVLSDAREEDKRPAPSPERKGLRGWWARLRKKTKVSE